LCRGWNADLRLALEMTDAADAITVPRFRSPGLAVEAKADLPPVSVTDRAVEEALR
jgi:histidinol-phosphatase